MRWWQEASRDVAMHDHQPGKIRILFSFHHDLIMIELSNRPPANVLFGPPWHQLIHFINARDLDCPA
jgi:hypothetical protein